MKRLQTVHAGVQRRAERGQVAHEPQQVQTPHLTPHEAVAYLKIGSRSALYRLIREHRLPYGRVGRRYRFRRDHLDRWIEVRGVAALAAVRSA